jgi:formylglycine-generating enzyme required for sulfatase activity
MKTRTMKQSMKLVLGAVALGMCLSALGQAPVIGSLTKNGVLLCTNLVPGTTASVEWAPSVIGPWTNNWAGLDALTVDANGMIQVSVPMFYRVRGTGAPTGMVLIPAGSFTMGDTFAEWETDERPTHSVYVSAFYMDQYEVTKTLWDDVHQWATNNGYSFDNIGSGKGPNRPVHTINWYDTAKWCNARSEKEGLTPCYYTDGSQTSVYRSGRLDLTNGCVNWSAAYRLPTEAEWEKAARGGASGHRFPGSDVDTVSHSRANYYADTNSPFAFDSSPTQGFHPTYAVGGTPFTSPVGSFMSNGYGLYDAAGNVSEWCWDWYTIWYSRPEATQNDARGPNNPLSNRVVRDGAWDHYAFDLRCANRSFENPSYNNHQFLGFRCVRGL